MSSVLAREFYESDPLLVARRLLGCVLAHEHPTRGRISGRIVETEAYRGEEDLACHASKGITGRTRLMFGEPGVAYVYLIYGMYDMFNAVCWPAGQPSAVLVRGLEPMSGIERTTDGPGKLCRALGIDRTLNGIDLSHVGGRLTISAGVEYSDEQVSTSPRIGVDYAGEWAARPWRFYVKGNRHVSRAARKPQAKIRVSRGTRA